MKTPYELLEVAPDATDAEIKQAYLEKVKDNPPDRDQERFQLIHEAYLSIKDHKSRLSHALFNAPSADFDELLDQALHTTQAPQVRPEHFKQLLRAGLDETIRLDAKPHAGKS
ncbi:J domain-containing protein [Methylobacter sp. YRD-M1]|uniref:J domain-containing protein n=1 Tax=Methylobacter sp. YRD-M1 TaxID=2911520 RepID=UPI00227D1CA5|nr:DnaJ domain-containing protein [Methylobacter sp. YRD-M1]WAK00653.1 J domain-containing protein [Methylobacter sp. YRD-M1]